MKKFWALLIIWPLLAGCGISFYYNKLDWFANWYLDDFVELTDSQQSLFENQFERWHQWHRNTQLPLYYQQLQQVKQDLQQGITASQILAHTHQARAHWITLLKHISPEASRQLLNLSVEQKQELVSNLSEEIEEKIEKYDDKSEQERIEDNEKRNIKSFKKWFGRLTDEQEQQIKALLKKYQSSRVMWLSYRQNYVNQFETLLFNHQDPAQLAKLVNLLGYPDQMRSAELQKVISSNQQIYAQFLAKFIAQAGEAQKQHLYDEIDEYLQELASLIEAD